MKKLLDKRKKKMTQQSHEIIYYNALKKTNIDDIHKQKKSRIIV